MEKKEKRESDESQQIIDEKYIESVVKDRNSLLICLNRLLTNQWICRSNSILIEIHCNHFDDYIKYISAKVLINYIIEGKVDLKSVCLSQYWHCLPQMCQFFTRLSNRISIAECLGFEFIINQLNDKLSESESSDNLCETHCFCCVTETIAQIICETKDQNINQFVLKLIQLFPRLQKRCFVYKLIDLMIDIMKESDRNCLSIETISIWVFQQNFFTETIKFSNQFYSFGGKYLSDLEVIDKEFNFDVVLLRESVLLYLLALSSDLVLRSTSDDIIKDRLKVVSQFVRNKCEKFDENDWMIKLFIEEDEQLLSSIYCVIRLGDNQMCNSIMNSFIESIDCDSSVLLDLLCDEQTAILLLKLLLNFLKLNDISTNISINVKNVLTELRDKMQRLTAKELFPYNVNPLIRLLNKLR